MSRSKLFVLIPITFSIWIIWFSSLGFEQAISNVLENWEITITMIFGSIIAGATSMGGGAVAFPVFTKVLAINPHDAKVFSLAIQSVGMGAATMTIILTGIKVDWRVIVWATLGGIIGIFIGSYFLVPILIPATIKMSFTVMLTSFAVTLLALNKGVRQCHENMPILDLKEKIILLLAGITGGIMSGLVGNGIDIICFSVMVLLFRISEKVATPTSVILMAFNAMAGFMLSFFFLDDFTIEAKNYWLAAIPVVVVGAPLGSILCSIMKREIIANVLIALIFVELVTSLLLIPLTPNIILSSLTVLMVFSGLNYWMYRHQFYEPLPGKKLITQTENIN